MKFTVRDAQFDTDEMIVVPEAVRSALGIYITRDHTQVFAAYFCPDIGVNVIAVEDFMLEQMAKGTGNLDLQRALNFAKNPRN